jgi:hypothetical protein
LLFSFGIMAIANQKYELGTSHAMHIDINRHQVCNNVCTKTDMAEILNLGLFSSLCSLHTRYTHLTNKLFTQIKVIIVIINLYDRNVNQHRTVDSHFCQEMPVLCRRLTLTPHIWSPRWIHVFINDVSLRKRTLFVTYRPLLTFLTLLKAFNIIFLLIVLFRIQLRVKLEFYQWKNEGI